MLVNKLCTSDYMLRKSALYYMLIERGKVPSEVNKGERLVSSTGHLCSQFWTWVFTDAKDMYLYEDKNGNLQWKWWELN
jgi:hypothetical protein